MRSCACALVLGVVFGSAGLAAPPPAPPPPQPADDSLIEFLGSDDVEDASVWDYLVKKTQRTPAPTPPPQEEDR